MELKVMVEVCDAFSKARLDVIATVGVVVSRISVRAGDAVPRFPAASAT